MTKTLDIEGLDELFLQILKGLLNNVINKSDDAAEKILALSTELVGKDVQSALMAFHKLYHDENIDQNTDFNRQIDDIIETHQQGNDVEAIDLQEHDGASLVALQQKLEQAINVDKEMKAKTAPILCAIQFSELIHRHVGNIERAWQYSVTKLAEGCDCDTIAIDIDSLLTTQYERQAFNQHVLKMELLLETEEEVDHLLEAIL